ncbi:MAG: YkvA family protein [Tissierellia bacterium]|nr:YkvA family protein [Tissierellia bacterium]
MKIDFDKTMHKLQFQATKLLGDRTRLSKLTKKAMDMVTEKHQFSEIKEDVLLSLHLIWDWSRGNYKGVSKKSLLMIAGSILYLLNPFDLIPDFILGIGFLDDVTIFLSLIHRISDELNKYRHWRQGYYYE